MNVKVYPFAAKGTIVAAPSKSYAHRFLIAAALTKGRTIIRNIGSSDDVMRTVDCLSALGAEIKIENGNAEVFGIGSPNENVVLPVGESGTTLRLIMPVVSALGVSATFLCGKTLVNRPIGGLIDVLTSRGAIVERVANGYRVSGKLVAGDYFVSGEISSQYISGLLFALPLLGGKSCLTAANVTSAPYVDMTLSVLEMFGVSYMTEKCADNCGKPAYKSLIDKNCRYITNGEHNVFGDYSSSAAFLALGAVCGRVTVENLSDDKQGDRAIISILNKMNCDVYAGENFVSAKNEKGKIVLSPLKYDFERCPDLVPVVVALCCFAGGVSELGGVERLKFKECDRLVACMKMCETVGIKTEYSNGILKIFGGNPQPINSKPIVFETFDDHRMVMASVVLGVGLNREFTVAGADSVNKSCPEFWKKFKEIGGGFDVGI